MARTDNRADLGPVTAPARDVSDFGVLPTAAVVSVVDTTELRWFTAGRLPLDVESWFTGAGTTGMVEERCDSYRMDGLGDRGVKRRSGATLELKVRQSVRERLTLEAGLAGRLEMWRKWSPADGLVESDGDQAWVDVHKKVIKRRFSVDGDEIVLTPGAPAMSGAGCDIEVVAVTVDGVDAWACAFAGFGPTPRRRDTIVASWRALAADTPPPTPFGALFGHSSGYPEWLAGVHSSSRQPPARATSGNASTR